MWKSMNLISAICHLICPSVQRYTRTSVQGTPGPDLHYSHSFCSPAARAITGSAFKLLQKKEQGNFSLPRSLAFQGNGRLNTITH